MVDQEIPLEIKRMEADGGRTIGHKARHPLDPTTYDTTDDGQDVHEIPRSVLSRVWGFIKSKRKTLCVNKNELAYYGRRYPTCPVPPERRFGRDRAHGPWYCGYCRLFDSPWEGK